MSGELGGALESVIFSQAAFSGGPNPQRTESWLAGSVPPRPSVPLSFWGLSSFHESGIFFAHNHEDAALWASIEASFLNRQALKSFSSELVANSLQKIEAHYIITEAREWVSRLFYAQRGLPRLLLDAVRPLRQAFGDRLLQLQAISDGDEISLRATVQWADDPESARVAREKFDQHWWLDNCNRAHGYLVFDYELVDAV